MAGYKPSPLAEGLSLGRTGKPALTTDIELPNESGRRDPRLSAPVERPIGTYDKGRAKREMSRPLFGSRKVSR